MIDVKEIMQRVKEKEANKPEVMRLTEAQKRCCTFKYGKNLPTNFVACVDCPLDTMTTMR